MILPVADGRKDALIERLLELRRDWYHGQSSDQHRSPLQYMSSLHFMRFVVIEPNIYLRNLRGGTQRPGTAEAYGNYRPHLLLETWYDGELKDHLDEMLAGLPADAPEEMVPMARLIPEMFGYCSDCPALVNDAAVRDFLLRRNLQQDRSNTPFVGARGRSARRIRDEQRLYLAIRKTVDKKVADGQFHERDSQAIHNALREEFVDKDAGGREFVCLEEGNRSHILHAPPPDLTGFARLISRAGLQNYVYLVLQALVGLLGVAALLSLLFQATGWSPDWAWPRGVSLALTAMLLPLLGLLLLLAYHERRDDQFEAVLRNPAMSVKNEEHVLQNPMTSSIPVKHGPFRLASLQLVLWFTRWWATHMATGGRLAGISSIHFARWSIVTEPPMLLFTSNYNRSWESYLGEFVDDAANGLSAIWGHAQGFPRTRWLVTEGAHNEQAFKAYSRNAMLETQLWYSAYWDISMLEILRNSRVRRGLFTKHLDADAARAWVELL